MKFLSLKRKVKRIRDLYLYCRYPGSLVLHKDQEVAHAFDDEHDNWCFVVQGPISGIKIIQLKKLSLVYPEAYIIISTWKPNTLEENRRLEEISSFVSEVVTSDFPKFTGIMNSNLQAVQLRTAVDKLRLLQNIEYVIKLRGDCLPNYPENIVSYFRSLDELFPNRLWGLDINTISNIPFSLSDIMMWGSKGDFVKYWTSCDLVEKNITPSEFIRKSDSFSDLRYIRDNKPPESNYCWSYVVGHLDGAPSYNSDCWFKYLKIKFGVFSSLHIGLFFGKYSEEHQCYSRNSDRYISFEKWLSNL